MRVTLVSLTLERSVVSPALIPDPTVGDVPRPAALVRDFVNTLDHELGHRRAGHHGRADGLPGDGTGCSTTGRPTSGSVIRPWRCAPACTRRWSSTTPGERSSLVALDEVLAGLPVRLRWAGDGVVAVPGRGGVAGALARHRPGGARGPGERGLVATEDLRLRRVRLGLLRPLEEPVAPLLRVRLRQQAQDPRLPRPPPRRAADGHALSQSV